MKEYEINTPTGKTTVLLSDEDAEERGLSGGKPAEPARQLDSATGAPKEDEPDEPDDEPVESKVHKVENKAAKPANKTAAQSKRDEVVAKAFNAPKSDA